MAAFQSLLGLEALSNASGARAVRMVVESCQPTTRREKTSSTKAAYTHPENVRIYVCDPQAVRSRRIELPPDQVCQSLRQRTWHGRAGSLGLTHALEPGPAHQPFHGAASHLVAGTIATCVYFPGRVDTVIFAVHLG